MPKGALALILGLLAADALGTQVAVRLGISSNHEGAGNHVARLNAEGVSRELESAGFRVCVRRYLMYYKHEPGRVMRLLSRPGVHHVCRWAARLANVALGRWGNKLQVTAVRAGQFVPQGCGADDSGGAWSSTACCSRGPGGLHGKVRTGNQA